jgi:hypothetical protein
MVVAAAFIGMPLDPGETGIPNNRGGVTGHARGSSTIVKDDTTRWWVQEGGGLLLLLLLSLSSSPHLKGGIQVGPTIVDEHHVDSSGKKIGWIGIIEMFSKNPHRVIEFLKVLGKVISLVKGMRRIVFDIHVHTSISGVVLLLVVASFPPPSGTFKL